MRIAHVISDTNIGGAGRYLLALLPGAPLFGWEPIVYVPEGALAEAVRATGLAQVVPLPEGERSFSIPLWRWLQSNLRDADVVHTHASLAARLVAKQRGYPVVLTRHTIGPDLPPGGLKPWRRALHRFVASAFGDAIIAVSEACRQRLLQEGVPAEQIRVIYHGIDVQPFLTARGNSWRQKLGLSAEEPVILTVARLTPVKGLQHALAAASLLQEQQVPFTWLFVGGGPLLSELRDKAQALGLGEQVRWLGFQSDVAGLLAAADVFVLPSLQEALGLALLEAMAAELPIVASHVGGIPELIRSGEQGLLVPPGDSGALAAAIRALLTDRQRAAQLGAAGRERVLAQFTVQKMWQQTDAVYRQIKDRRRWRK